MSEPKFHHLVPKFYLERFTKDGKVEVVERNNPARFFAAKPRNVLGENHFYAFDTDEGRDNAVEKMLGEHVEGPAAEAFRRLVDQGRSIVAPGIRGPICTFLAFQRVRGNAVRQMIVEHHKATMRKVLSLATPAEVMRVARLRGEEMTEEDAIDTAEYARSGEYTLEVASEANVHLSSVLKAALAIAPMLNARTWRILEFSEPCLVTCDEPVALVGADPLSPGNASGLAHAHEVVFPIDPRHALLMIRPDRDSNEIRGPGTARQAEIINLHVAFSSDRYLVRHPGTDPLRGIVLPKKAPPVFVFGDVVAMQQDATEESRAKFLAKVRRGEVRFAQAPEPEKDEPSAD